MIESDMCRWDWMSSTYSNKDIVSVDSFIVKLNTRKRFYHFAIRYREEGPGAVSLTARNIITRLLKHHRVFQHQAAKHIFFILASCFGYKFLVPGCRVRSIEIMLAWQIGGSSNSLYFVSISKNIFSSPIATPSY